MKGVGDEEDRQIKVKKGLNGFFGCYRKRLKQNSMKLKSQTGLALLSERHKEGIKNIWCFLEQRATVYTQTAITGALLSVLKQDGVYMIRYKENFSVPRKL